MGETEVHRGIGATTPMCKDEGIQKSRETEIQRYKDTEVHGYKGIGIREDGGIERLGHGTTGAQNQRCLGAHSYKDNG